MANGLAKLQLLIELKNKLKTGLDVAKKQVEKSTGQMQSKLNSFKLNNVKMFDAIKDQVPGATGALSMLANPYVLATAAVLGLVMMLGSATAKAMEFEHKFTNIRQLNLDKSRAELNAYRMDILRTSMQTGVSNQEMHKATTIYNLLLVYMATMQPKLQRLWVIILLPHKLSFPIQ